MYWYDDASINEINDFNIVFLMNLDHLRHRTPTPPPPFFYNFLCFSAFFTLPKSASLLTYDSVAPV